MGGVCSREQAAAHIGSLLNKRGQSGLAMRDAAVFVSLSSPDTSIGGHAGVRAWVAWDGSSGL
jgi:hypothetical protein